MLGCKRQKDGFLLANDTKFTFAKGDLAETKVSWCISHCFLFVFTLFPACIHTVSCLYSHCFLFVFTLFPVCISHCFLFVFTLFPVCIHTVSCLYSHCFLSECRLELL